MEITKFGGDCPFKMRTVAVAVAVTLSACGGGGDDAPAPTAFPLTISDAKARCEGMVGQEFGPATISSATLVPEVTTPAANARPEYCSVTAYKTGKPIFQMQAWLPTTWTGGLVQAGGGGLNGFLWTFPVWNQTQPLQQGLVYINSNAGNNDPSGRLLLDRETLRDYSYQHIGTTYEFGQKIMASYYSKSPAHNYFMGCSRGGGEAMAAASIYPDNYDGIVAQAPAPEMKAFIARSASQGPLTPVTTGEWNQILNAYIGQCDALDGVSDGVVSSKQACTFDPIAWVATQNWTAAKQATVRSQYSDLRLSNGTLVNQKYPLGQFFDLTSLGQPWLRIAKNDFSWTYDVKNFNLDADWGAISSMADSVALDVDPVKLGQFLKKGKKMLVFMGGDDAALSIVATNEYVNKVVSYSGGNGANTQTRYFPGVGHCGSLGGTNTTTQLGPERAEMLGALRDWVEKGTAPSEMVATRLNADGSVKLTRPLCLVGTYPKYKGSGDVNSAVNFVCAPEGS